jgi:peptidylprolyl isomerase
VCAVSIRLPQRRLVRGAAALLVPALLIPALAACASKTGYGDATVSGFDVATIGGDFGKAPTLQWTGVQAYPETTQVKTLVQGTGAAVGTGSVDLHIYLGDSQTDVNKASDSCNQPSDSASASPSSAPTPSAAASTAVPTPSPLKSCAAVTWPLKGTWAYSTADGSYDSLSATAGTIWQTVLSGAKIGSRIEVLTGSDQVFPGSASAAPGNPSIGIGTRDPLVMVVDVIRTTPVAATPSDDKVHDVKPSALPKVLTNGKDVPQGLDWKGIAKPDPTTPVQRVILKQGKGAVVGANDTVTVNYYGMTYKAKKPFDQSYVDKTDPTKPGQPFTSALSGLVKGWAIGLTGVKAGSRVLLQIPPSFGYGAQGSPPTIPGNATLWFVVDVISTKAGS